MKQNCWEFKQCGREIGGELAESLGICPAAYDIRLDGIHDGICAGRACWALRGTHCDDHVQGTFEQKYRNCGKCEFYEYVKEQEGEELTPTLLLLRKLQDLG